MLNEEFLKSIEIANEVMLREALRLLLIPHGSPVFGAAKVIEHEVAAFNALKILSYIDQSADEFDLVEKLRVTKPKARSLLYQVALRSEDNHGNHDEAMRKILTNPLTMREGNHYLLEVSDPLTMDRLRKRVRNLGFISDGSFSGSVAKLPEPALLELIESLISSDEKADILRQFQKMGLPDTTIKGAIKAILSTAGKKVAGEVGDQIGEALNDLIGDLFKNCSKALLMHYNLTN